MAQNTFQGMQFLPQQKKNQFEIMLKNEIQKYFSGVEIFLTDDIAERFGSYMNGVNLCILYNCKLITIHLLQTNLKDLTHFIFCSKRLIELNQQMKLYMISATNLVPTGSSLNLLNDLSITNIVSYDQSILINQILHTINNILTTDNESMEIVNK